MPELVSIYQVLACTACCRALDGMMAVGGPTLSDAGVLVVGTASSGHFDKVLAQVQALAAAPCDARSLAVATKARELPTPLYNLIRAVDIIKVCWVTLSGGCGAVAVALWLWLWRCGCGCGAVAMWLRGFLQLCVSGCRTSVSAVVTFVLWARQQVRQALSRRDWAAVRRLIAEGGNHTVGVATAAHELFVVSSQVASDEAEEELRAAFEHGRIVAPPGGVGDIDLSAISVSVCRVDCVPRPVVQQP